VRRPDERTIEEQVPRDRSALGEENAILRSQFASSPVAAYLQDRAGRFRFVTSSAARSFGLTSEALEGRTWQELGLRSELIGALEDLRKETLTTRRPGNEAFRSPYDARNYAYRVAPVWGNDGEVQGTFTLALDVTEKIELESMREKEGQLRAIVDGARDPVFVKDLEGRYLVVNPATLQALGRTLDEVLGKNDLAIHANAEVAKTLMAHDRRILRQGISEVVEERVQTPSGDRIFLTSRMPLRDHQGQIASVVGIARDITDRKQMEEGLRAGEQRFRALIENAPVAIAMSQEGRTTFGNRRYLEMFGYKDNEELKGRPFLEQIAPQDRQRALEFAMSIEKGRSREARMDLQGLRKDGSEFPFRAAITSLDLGDGPLVFGFFTDVTERKKAEEEMLQARRKFESLFSASNEGIALHDIVYDDEGRIVDYRILDVNPAYERILGIPKSRAVGALGSELYGANEPPYLDIFTRVCVTGKPVTLETYFPPLKKDFLISTFSPAKGQFATIFIDITERKRLEKDLEDAKSRAELYVDLLTHDISNYNTAAMGYLQLAEMRIKLDEKERKLIINPLLVLGNSSELIANIRDLKRVEAGREKTGPLDVCRVLREVREAYEDPPGRDVTINLKMADSCWVLASGLLRDAFSNIVSNAIKHSSGPVTVDIWVARDVDDESGQVKVSIEDNGPGIPDERKDKIFDRSLMGLTKPVSRGLGLYLVKRLLEEYDGAVWVEDRIPGDHTKGARFVVLLPAASLG
jgi:PAS domain S-box-containing protein